MTAESGLSIDQNRGSGWLFIALGLSVLFHLGLLLVQIVEPTRPRPVAELIISLASSEAQPPPPNISPEQPLEPAAPNEPPPEPEPDPEPSEEPMQESATEDIDQAMEPTPDISAAEQAPSEPAAEALLTTRLLSSLRENLGSPTIPQAPPATTAAPVPALPDPLSWINQYVGRVEPTQELWQNPDGSRQGRIVTESGQVYCGKARAPTTDEIFSPSLATNLMLWRDCGRIRPDPADLSDPRLRTPRP